MAPKFRFPIASNIKNRGQLNATVLREAIENNYDELCSEFARHEKAQQEELIEYFNGIIPDDFGELLFGLQGNEIDDLISKIKTFDDEENELFV